MKFLTYSTYPTRKLIVTRANADKERQKQFVELLKKNQIQTGEGKNSLFCSLVK